MLAWTEKTSAKSSRTKPRLSFAELLEGSWAEVEDYLLVKPPELKIGERNRDFPHPI
jgi:hypothetical protein